MRLPNVAGEKAFVDDSASGSRPPVRRRERSATGGDFRVWCARRSNLTYAEATWTAGVAGRAGQQGLLVRPRDQTAPTARWRRHHSVAILPRLTVPPRDEAKVEAGVRFAQTYILGRLRALTFFSLAECNEAIALVMQRMNERPMRKLGVSRRELFGPCD